jgi:hypothetical protein
VYVIKVPNQGFMGSRAGVKFYEGEGRTSSETVVERIRKDFPQYTIEEMEKLAPKTNR